MARWRSGRKTPPRVGAVFEFGPAYDQPFRMRGVRQFAMQAGWQLDQCPFASEQLAAGEKFDGLVGMLGPRLVRQARRRGIPAVNVWTNYPAGPDVPCVFLNVVRVGEIMAEHLVARGLVRFGHLLRQDRPFTKLLREGFLSRLGRDSRQTSLSVCNLPEGMYDNVGDWRRGIARMDQWIASWKTPIGVFSHNLSLLHVLVGRCRYHHRLNIPRELAVICGGEQTQYPEHPSLMISSVRLNYERVGLEAAALLDRLMRGRKPPRKPILVEPGEIIVRESTDVTAVDDPMVAAAMLFMAERCRKPIQVRDVAAAAAVGRRTLEKRFRALLDRSVAGQLEYMRVERAKRLLAESDQPAKCVALQCGFSSGKQLRRAFIRNDGVTPADYRRKMVTSPRPPG